MEKEEELEEDINEVIIMQGLTYNSANTGFGRLINVEERVFILASSDVW
ncbi:predicted protein [Sclerotinia sclerotiorum 1980 UF-70]|uniref:Uncharacterized protein n=1 Tax=Sclerotinia sclerotiorum (strain ATCC 18683 / 1980 / Ss-1) TaxID=665079 RepID=A7E676_SCLS1|nr:predicted protein [Sclerotinia sclerotiorum 1980 UF-70]EDN91398.1 predicted protein [Sclerotinia sclerotiorum 1980 UF-70]